MRVCRREGSGVVLCVLCALHIDGAVVFVG